ncbi:MAG: hypothetical protein GX963_14695 [Bacteroidales bacterium]|nr:hypothetical protein [Bacteroidales bacterium]
MEEKLLVEKSRSTKVNAEVILGDFRYNVEYDFAEKKLGKLSCNIYKSEGNEYAGYMQHENGNTNFNFPEEESIETHVSAFQKILAEAKAKESIK